MCRLEKFHLPLRPNLKDWNMMTLNKKWMRLMVLVGCAALTASCKQAPVYTTLSKQHNQPIPLVASIFCSMSSYSNLLNSDAKVDGIFQADTFNY